MAKLVLFWDTRRNKLVQGFRSAVPFPIPDVVQGTTLELEVTLLEDSESGPLSSTPYSKLSPSLGALSVGIGSYNTASGATPTFYQNSFATDTVNNKYTGTLPISESAASLALGSEDSVPLRFMLSVVTAAGRQDFDFPVTLRAHVLGSGATDPVPVDEFLTKAQVEAMFSKKVMPAGESITLVSPDGTRRTVLYVTNDGEFHSDTL